MGGGVHGFVKRIKKYVNNIVSEVCSEESRQAAEQGREPRDLLSQNQYKNKYAKVTT